VVEVLGAGERGGQAGDTEDDLLARPGAVEVAAVAAQAEGLGRAGEDRVVGGGGADRAALGAAVAAVLVDVGGLHPVGVGAGQQGLGRGAGQWLVPLQDQDVVGVQLVGDQAGGLLGGVQRVLPRRGSGPGGPSSRW
jgi:hypothetical protein